MEDQPIVGTTAWKPYQVVLEVPDEAARIAFGCLLAGEGAVWCDDFEFEIVDNTTPTSTELAAVYPDHPSNLSFEEPTRRRRRRLSQARMKVGAGRFQGISRLTRRLSASLLWEYAVRRSCAAAAAPERP